MFKRDSFWQRDLITETYLQLASIIGKRTNCYETSDSRTDDLWKDINSTSGSPGMMPVPATIESNLSNGFSNGLKGVLYPI